MASVGKSKTLENFDQTPGAGSQASGNNFSGAVAGQGNVPTTPEAIDKDLLANGISPKDLEIEHLTN